MHLCFNILFQGELVGSKFGQILTYTKTVQFSFVKEKITEFKF